MDMNKVDELLVGCLEQIKKEPTWGIKEKAIAILAVQVGADAIKALGRIANALETMTELQLKRAASDLRV